MAEFKGQCLTAGQVPEQGNGRGGCGNASGEKVLVGVSPMVAIQTVVAAKGTGAGSGGAVGADVTKAKEPCSSQQEAMSWVWRLKKKQEKVQRAERYTVYPGISKSRIS